MSKNDITGDKLISKVSTKEYESNYDRIFGQKKVKKVSKLSEDWNETRMDIIGQNGNTGDVYEEVDKLYTKDI